MEVLAPHGVPSPAASRGSAHLDSAIAPFDLSLNEKPATPHGSSLLEEAIGGMSTLLEYLVELESLCLQTHGTKNGQARQGMPSISVRKSFRQNQKSL